MKAREEKSDSVLENFLGVLSTDKTTQTEIDRATRLKDTSIFSRIFNGISIDKIVPKSKIDEWVSRKKKIAENITDNERQTYNLFTQEDAEFPGKPYKQLELLMEEITLYVYRNFLTLSGKLHPEIIAILSKQRVEDDKKQESHLAFSQEQLNKMFWSLMENILGGIDINLHKALGPTNDHSNFINPNTDDNWKLIQQAQKILTVDKSCCQVFISKCVNDQLTNMQDILQKQISDLIERYQGLDKKHPKYKFLKARELALVNAQVAVMEYFSGKTDAQTMLDILDISKQSVMELAGGSSQKPQDATTSFLSRQTASFSQKAKQMANTAGKSIGFEVATSGSVTAIDNVIKIVTKATENERAVSRALDKKVVPDSPPPPRPG